LDELRPNKRRLAYHEKRELETLPATIEELDAKIEELHCVVAQPDFYKQPSIEVARQQALLKNLHQQLAAAYERWEELERLAD
jgi:ATP-binding cassette subfamily F protein uup